MTEEFRSRVAAGATLLDEEKPGWYKEIDFRNLRLESADSCILGQLYRNYFNGLDALSLSDPLGVRFGFQLDWDDHAVGKREETFEVLRSNWVDEIAARLTVDQHRS